MRRCVPAILAVLLAACGAPPEVPTGLPAGDFSLHWVAAEPEVELGAPVSIRLWMRVGSDVDATPPRVESVYADLEGGRLRARDDAQWLDQDRERLYTRSYELQWLRLGARELPPLSHTATRRSGKGVDTVEAKTDSLEFTVKEVLPENADARAEVPGDLIADAPPPPIWPWLLAFAAICGLVVLVWFWRRRRAARPQVVAPEIPDPPDQVALARLKALAVELREGRVGGERLVVEVSDVLRHWLHDGLELHALERTTEEFLQDLGRGTRLPVALRQILQAFLERCDLVKFAAQRPDLEQCHSLLQTARELVENTRDRQTTEPLVAAAVGGSDG